MIRSVVGRGAARGAKPQAHECSGVKKLMKQLLFTLSQIFREA